MCQDLFHSSKRSIYTGDGYTLIEIIVSILFFSAISLSLAHVLTSNMLLTGENQKVVTSNNLAKQYLRDTQIKWKLQQDYDDAELPNAGSSDYTDNGKFNLVVDTENLGTDELGNILLRRVTVRCNDAEGKEVVNIFLDYNRPGN